jgi:hypothetical protein
MPTQDAAQPLPLHGNREMPTSPHLDLAQLRPHSFSHRDPLQIEAAAPRPRADVREAEKVERLRPPEAPRPARCSDEPCELDQTRLLGLQLQRESSEPIPQVPEELLGVALMLKPHHEVIDEAHDDHVTASGRAR